MLPDTVLGLRTNRAFVEAYMIGLNVEMARELLWRGFPTDQQGTYFRNFWGTDGAAAATGDIGDLRENLARALGTAPPNSPADPVRAAAAQQPAAPLPERDHLSDAGGAADHDTDAARHLSDLQRRDGAGHQLRRLPDHARQRRSAARGNPGYYVVIQEHPTEPRFGLDAPVTTAAERDQESSRDRDRSRRQVCR